MAFSKWYNIDCNIVEDAKTYLNKFIKIVNDKQV